jgi:signal transduction histidine kinase
MTMHVDHTEVSRHKCLIYDGDPSEQLPIVVPLLLDGLHENWRCLYLGSPEDVEMIEDALSDEGVDTRHEQKRHALVLSSDRSHLVDGRFDPATMVDGLSSSIDQALEDGFLGLCATGDMRWELGADENFDRLLEYEARLERVFRDKPLRGICQYHRGLVPPQALEDALTTHRATYVGDKLNNDNLFYVPPELLLEAREGDEAKRGAWMCRQLLRVQAAERARDEVLRDLERRVAERTAELDTANRQLRAFSYSVSHDLRAPLRAIVGFGNALAEDHGEKLDADGRKNIDRVLAAANRMSQLIEGMLVLGRAVEVDMRRVSVDLTALVFDVTRELREAEPARSVDLVVDEGLRAVGDPVLLRAVVSNLVGNAWKFTSQCARARIEVGRKGTEGTLPVFYVRDNGAGFDMQYAKNLFGVFQRLHHQDEFPGTGVGLATVERIVSRHGGRIWADARLGEGATFFFTLPDGSAA